jgi:hypothetical protein
MIVLNNNEDQQTHETARYGEILKNFRSGREIISSREISDLSKLAVPGKSAIIIELKH